MRRKEFKDFPVYNLKAATSGRIRKGITAVTGNVDAQGDRIVSGAFQKTLAENRGRIKHLWQHDFWNPPIAKIVEIKEVGQDELPDEVREKSPNATGGLMVAREYYKDVPLSEWVLKGIDSGEINEMSIGFDIITAEDVNETIDEKEITIRELKELRLFDTSDVNWGANAATVAAGAKTDTAPLPIGLIAQKFNEAIENSSKFTDTERGLIWQMAVKAFGLFPEVQAGTPILNVPLDLLEKIYQAGEEPDDDTADDPQAGAAQSTSPDRFFDIPIPFEI